MEVAHIAPETLKIENIFLKTCTQITQKSSKQKCCMVLSRKHICRTKI